MVKKWKEILPMLPNHYYQELTRLTEENERLKATAAKSVKELFDGSFEKAQLESRIQELEHGIRKEIQVYTAYIKNMEWHIKTNNPNENALKEIEGQLRIYKDLVAWLSSLLSSKDKTE
jgi:hypothetical protein